MGCTVIQAEGVIDVDIAEAAADTAYAHSTTLIGEDTDLFILLLQMANHCILDRTVSQEAVQKCTTSIA